jgi:hypothetical protein
MIVFYLVHQNVVILAIPKVIYYRITIINQLSTTLNPTNAILNTIPLYVPCNRHLGWFEYINQIIWDIRITLYWDLDIIDLKLFRLNSILFLNFLLDMVIRDSRLLFSGESNRISSCGRDAYSMDILDIIWFHLVIFIISDIDDSLWPTQHQSYQYLNI